MKKICLLLAVVMLLSSIFIITSFAASETITWGQQPSLLNESRYAVFDLADKTYDEVIHNYNSVGYTYRDAQCNHAPNARVRFFIEKKVSLGRWECKNVSIGPVNNTVEMGYGGAFGAGTYRFMMQPVDNISYNDYGIPSGNALISIQEFYSKSSSETSRMLSWNLSESE